MGSIVNIKRIHYDPILKWAITTFSTSTTGGSLHNINRPCDKKAVVSKAMLDYLERAGTHEKFMKNQNMEFKLGKRHLANIMGTDPEQFSQDDISRSIMYLFPSGLYDGKARPNLKSLYQIIPQKKDAEFNESGRPFHSMFYTGRPNYYKLKYEIVQNINKVNTIEDSMFNNQLTVDSKHRIDNSGHDWICKDALEKHLLEDISDAEYNNCIVALKRLVQLSYSYTNELLIGKYRKPLLLENEADNITKTQFTNHGKSFTSVHECLRKSSLGVVTVISPGTGRITINDKNITYFEVIQNRQQVLFPLIFTNMIKKVDIVAAIHGGGFSSQAGTIRWGIAMGLRSFVDAGTIQRMRTAGLLQRDFRNREREKPGQAGARRKYTWKKR